MNLDAVKHKVLGKIMTFLAYRPRTFLELTRRLDKYLMVEKDLREAEKAEVRDRVKEYLVDSKLVDDEGFAKTFIESKCVAKAVLGKRAILAKLIEKGISASDAKEYIDAAIPEKIELQNAVKALGKKYKAVSTTVDTRQIKDKMGRYLLSRGYSYSTARQAVDYFLKRP